MASNVSQLRHDIDSGRTGDKVPVTDPASAPLGTDDEAAGFPPSPREVDIARRNENRRPRGGGWVIDRRNDWGAGPAMLTAGLTLTLVVFAILMLLFLA